jgi:hypothetical protein
MVIRLVALSLVTACSLSTVHYAGPNGDDDAGTGDDVVDVSHSGSRLQVIRDAFPDGTTAPVAIYDSMLGVTCTAAAWSDGASYCTASTGFIEYSDASCSAPVILPAFDWTPGTPLFATTSAGTATNHLYRGGTAVSLAQIYDNSTGTCTPAGAGGTYYSIAGEITPSDLVAVTVSHDATGAMSYVYTRGADGLQTVDTSELHDNTLDSDCILGAQSARLQTTYCLPLPVDITSQFDDASCTKPLAAAGGSEQPAYVMTFPAAGECFEIDRVYPVATTVTRTQVFIRPAFDTACTATTIPSAPYYSVETAPQPLPALVHQPASQSGRRIENALRKVGSQTLVDADFYDTTLQTYCSPAPQPDGSIACLPEGLSVTTYFTDAACTASILVAVRPAIQFDCGFTLPRYASETIGTSTQIRPIAGDRQRPVLPRRRPPAAVDVRDRLGRDRSGGSVASPCGSSVSLILREAKCLGDERHSTGSSRPRSISRPNRAGSHASNVIGSASPRLSCRSSRCSSRSAICRCRSCRSGWRRRTRRSPASSIAWSRQSSSRASRAPMTAGCGGSG